MLCFGCQWIVNLGEPGPFTGSKKWHDSGMEGPCLLARGKVGQTFLSALGAGKTADRNVCPTLVSVGSSPLALSWLVLGRNVAWKGHACWIGPLGQLAGRISGHGRDRVCESTARERHNQMNAMLKAADGTVSLFIHPRCKTLLRGLETVKLKPGAQYVEAETREQHVTTALGYLVTRLFPARRYVKSGRKHWK